MSKASDKAGDGKPSGHLSADAVKITARGSELDVEAVEPGPDEEPKASRKSRHSHQPKASEPEGDEPAPGVDSRLANSPEPEYKGMRLGKSVVVNAPTHPNTGGYETKVTAPAHAPLDKTAGANASMAANAFEQRVTQEQGSH